MFDERRRVSCPAVPRTAWSEEMTQTSSLRRCSAARRSISGSASAAKRTAPRPAVGGVLPHAVEDDDAAGAADRHEARECVDQLARSENGLA